MYSRTIFITETNVSNKLPNAMDPKLFMDLQTLLMIGAVGYPDQKYHMATVELVQYAPNPYKKKIILHKTRYLPNQTNDINDGKSLNIFIPNYH